MIRKIVKITFLGLLIGVQIKATGSTVDAFEESFNYAHGISSQENVTTQPKRISFWQGLKNLWRRPDVQTGVTSAVSSQVPTEKVNVQQVTEVVVDHVKAQVEKLAQTVTEQGQKLHSIDAVINATDRSVRRMNKVGVGVGLVGAMAATAVVGNKYYSTKDSVKTVEEISDTTSTMSEQSNMSEKSKTNDNTVNNGLDPNEEPAKIKKGMFSTLIKKIQQHPIVSTIAICGIAYTAMNTDVIKKSINDFVDDEKPAIVQLQQQAKDIKEFAYLLRKHGYTKVDVQNANLTGLNKGQINYILSQLA